MKSTQRVILILKLLEIGQQLRTTDIAGRFNISIRTAYRDLELLRRMNLPLRIADGAYSLNKSAWSKWTNRHIGQTIRRLKK
jgi:predicted DNA-binding transcriptional regulator YafY